MTIETTIGSIKRISLTGAGKNVQIDDNSRGYHRQTRAFLYTNGEIEFDGRIILTLTAAQLAELTAAPTVNLMQVDMTAAPMAYNSRGELVSAARAAQEG